MPVLAYTFFFTKLRRISTIVKFIKETGFSCLIYILSDYPFPHSRPIGGGSATLKVREIVKTMDLQAHST